MKLSQIRTMDQLVLALASAGFTKIPGLCDPDFPRERGFDYFYWESRFITIACPAEVGHDDVQLVATFDADRAIEKWSCFESYAGSEHPADLTGLELNRAAIGTMLRRWDDSLAAGVG